MKFNSIYKNGKPDYFFITIDSKKGERAFIQPYFIVTDIDHPRRGSIKEMNVLENINDVIVYYGKATHGYGYSHSADVYGELIDIIRDSYGKELTDAEHKELNKINIHDDELTVSPELLEHLAELNKIALDKKFANL
mgnify:FL=1